MKKLLSLALVVASFIGMSAAEVTLDFNAQGYANQADVTTLTVDGVTVNLGSNGKNGPKYYTTGAAVRVYAGGTVQLTSDQTITKAVFTYSDVYNGEIYNFCHHQKATDAEEVTVSAGTLTETDTEGTWTGSSNDFTITIPNTGGKNGHSRIAKIVVTTAGEATSVSAPTFSPAAGTYYGAQTVALSTTSSDASIYFTLDGSTPTTASTLYSAPINVTSSLTIKAIAVKGNLVSEVAEAAYVINSINTVANIAAYKALEDGAVAAIGGPLTVYYTNGNNVYVKDNSGYLCLFTKKGDANVKKYKVGNVIPAGLGGTKATYQTYIMEMCDDFFGTNDATSTVQVEPEVVGASFVTNDNVLHLIKIENVNIVAQETAKYYTLTDASGATCTIYSNSAVATGDVDYIIALVTTYGGNAQLQPIEIAVPPTEIANIGALPTEADGVRYKITGDVTVIAQSGNQLYIKDDSGFMLVYGTLNKEYKNGDVLSGIMGSITVYHKMVEFVPVADSFGDAVEGPAVEPEVMPIEEIATDMVHQYFKIENVTLTAVEGSDRNFTMNDGSGDLTMRINGFGVTAPTELEHTYNVTGFVAVYDDVAQFYPVLIEDLDTPAFEVGDVNGDGSINSGDVSAVYNVMLGVETDEAIIGRADVNNDGTVNSADVSAVYSIMMSN